MMNISERLLTICGMVEDGSKVIDVGCDHALVDIYLAKYKNVKAIAADINANALQGAKENIVKNDVANDIEVVQTDGLDGLDITDSVILICGMGTSTIIEILDRVEQLTMKELVIQSNHDVPRLRKYLVKRGFMIADERYLVERKKSYTIMKFVIGKAKYNRYDYYLGPILKEKSSDYLTSLLKHYQTLLEQIPTKYFVKRKRTKDLICCIEKELEKF